MSARSTPEQNEVPAADTTTTRTASSRLKPSRASRMAFIIACVSALRLSGRLRTIRPMPLSADESTDASVMRASCRYGPLCDRVDFLLGVPERLEHRVGVFAEPRRRERRLGRPRGHLDGIPEHT